MSQILLIFKFEMFVETTLLGYDLDEAEKSGKAS